MSTTYLKNLDSIMKTHSSRVYTVNGSHIPGVGGSSVITVDEDADNHGVSVLTSLSARNTLLYNVTMRYTLELYTGSPQNENYYLCFQLPIPPATSIPIITSSNPIYFPGDDSWQLRHTVNFINPDNRPTGGYQCRVTTAFQRWYV